MAWKLNWGITFFPTAAQLERALASKRRVQTISKFKGRYFQGLPVLVPDFSIGVAKKKSLWNDWSCRPKGKICFALAQGKQQYLLLFWLDRSLLESSPCNESSDSE